MRMIAYALIASATLIMIAATTANAADANKPSKFTEPRLGLGAEIPDDLLFADDAITGDKPRSRVTVRSRKSNAPAAAPILKGWEVTDIKVNGENNWEVTEPIRPGCLDTHAIMSSLSEAGWTNFANHSTRRLSLAFDARRRDGRNKRVQVDRCTGEIIHVSASAAR